MQVRVEALQLLHHFLQLLDDSAKQLTENLQELANNVLPASSWELKRGTTQATDYARQLMAIMDSMVVAAEQGHSVEPLLQVCLHCYFAVRQGLVKASRAKAVVSSLMAAGCIQSCCKYALASC